jgi:hypothetical protein
MLSLKIAVGMTLLELCLLQERAHNESLEGIAEMEKPDMGEDKLSRIDRYALVKSRIP